MDPTGASLQVLTAMITPAVLISAAGTLAFSTSSRLSRVVDRVRNLDAQVDTWTTQESPTPDQAERRGLVRDQIHSLAIRVLKLRSAMTSFYVAIGFFVATSLAVGVVALTEWGVWGWVPVLTGLLGSAGLLYGSLLLIDEARLAVTSTLQEMEFVRRKIRLRDEPGA